MGKLDDNILVSQLHVVKSMNDPEGYLDRPGVYVSSTSISYPSPLPSRFSIFVFEFTVVIKSYVKPSHLTL